MLDKESTWVILYAVIRDFLKKIYSFIYFWVRRVFVAARGLSLAVASGGYFVAVRGLLPGVASLVAEHGF